MKQSQGSAISPHSGFQATTFWGVNTNYVPLSGEKAEQVPAAVPVVPGWEWITEKQTSYSFLSDLASRSGAKAWIFPEVNSYKAQRCLDLSSKALKPHTLKRTL